MNSNNDSSNAVQANNRQFNPASVKLPQFWIDNPVSWIAMAEAAFELHGVTGEDRYRITLSCLDSQTSLRCIDILGSTTEVNKYDLLRQRLLKVYTLSHAQRASNLLHHPGLGDQRPSVLMDRMNALRGDMPSDMLFRALFLERLPVEIRASLSEEDLRDDKRLAEAADSKWERFRSPQVNVHQIETSENVDAISRKASSKNLCFYHSRFKTRANKCIPPCAWKSDVQGSGNDNAGR